MANIPHTDLIESIRQVLRQYVDYYQKESNKIYANRPVDRDSYVFHLHVPVMVEFEISGMMTRSIKGPNEAQKLVDEVVRIIDTKKSDLDLASRQMAKGNHPFPTVEPDTEMEFSL